MEGDSKSKNFQIADHDTYPQGKLKISLEVKNNSSKCPSLKWNGKRLLTNTREVPDPRV